MLKENGFAWALSLSLAGHTSLFVLTTSHLNGAASLTPRTEDVEITYFEMKDTPQWEELPQTAVPEEAVSAQIAAGPIGPPASASLPLPAAVEKPPGFIGMPKPRLVERFVTGQSGNAGEGGFAREEALSKEMVSKLQDPVFATYYQSIREKIRKAAKRRYEGKRDSGDVSIGFTLFSNGRLKEVSVFRQTSQMISNLRTVAVQSLVDAAPFPPFPARFERGELSFLVVLTFEPKP